LRIDLGARPDRGAREHVGGVAAQLLDFLRGDDAFEDIEPVLPVRGQDVRVQVAVRIESHGAAVSDFPGEREPPPGVRFHALRVPGPSEFGSELGGGGF
jgi:hypothetical protein